MLYLDQQGLCFHFPDVHPKALCHINFHLADKPDPSPVRALMEDHRVPLFHLEEYAGQLPETWVKRGGLLAPVRSGQALRVSLSGNYPFAIKIATGKVNAVTGEAWTDQLNFEKQDYLISSQQGSLSGFQQPDGSIRPFVVSPMGVGATIEEEVTGAAEFGGIQLIAYPLKAAVFEKKHRPVLFSLRWDPDAEKNAREVAVKPLGLSASEPVKQETIKEDQYKPEDWETRQSRRCFIHLLDRDDFMRITGRRMNGKRASVIHLDYWRRKFGKV